MDPNVVRAVVWLAAFAVISHGAELQCQFCFKYFLESCDGTYRIEIGNLVLSEEQLKFTKHCSNEPLKNGHEIFEGSFATSAEISGNNFPMVTGTVPDQHPDYGIEGSIEKGSHQQIITDVENTIPLQQYPSVLPDELPIHVEEGLSELSIHPENNINGENTVYQYPDIFNPDQQPGYSGEGSVGTGAVNVINAVDQSKYIEGSIPASNPSYDGEESVDTAMDNIKINVGDNTNYQHLYPEGASPINGGSEDFEGSEMYNLITSNGQKIKRQPQYLENVPSHQYISIGGKGSAEIGTQHAINVEGENSIYLPQPVDVMNTEGVNSIYQSQHNIYQPQHLEGIKSGYDEENLSGLGMYNVIKNEGKNTIYQTQYPKGIMPGQNPSYSREGSAETGIFNEINNVGENTNYIPQYSGQASYGGEETVATGIHGVINKPQYLENYDREGRVEIGLHNVKKAEGENIIYQPQYPRVYKPRQYYSYVGEGSAESGIHNGINNEVENTYYQPQYPDGFKLGQHSGYVGERFVESGMHNVIIPKGESTVYQTQYPESFKHVQIPSYGRESLVETGKNNIITAEGENIFYQPQYPEGRNTYYQQENLEYFRPGQQPRKPKEREINIVTDHEIDIEEQHYPGRLKPKQQDFQLGPYPSYVREEIVGTGTQHAINAEGKNTVYQPSYPISFQPGQFSSNVREGSVGTGMHYEVNNEGENTIYQPQYPRGTKHGQYHSYLEERLIGTGMNTLRKPKYKYTINQPHYPEYFQSGQNHNVIHLEGENIAYQPHLVDNFQTGLYHQKGEEGSMQFGMHNAPDMKGEHTIYQSIYPENFKEYQQSNNVGEGLVQADINTLRKPMDKITVNYPRYPDREDSVGIGTHVINVDVENTGYQPQLPDSFYPSNDESASTGTGVFNAINKYHEINSAGEHTVYQPEYSEDAQPSQQPSNSNMGSVGIEMINVINSKDKPTVNEPHFSENFQLGQNSAHQAEGSVEFALKGQHTDTHAEHPDYLQLNQHPGNSGEVAVENGMHVLIESEGKNTLHEPQYPEIIVPVSSLGGKESVGIEREEGLIESGMHHVLNLKEDQTYSQEQQPEYLQPHHSVEASVGIEDQHVINLEGENTVHLPENVDVFKHDQYPNIGGEETVGIGIENVINNEGVNSIYQPQYSEGSHTDQFIGFGAEGSLGSGINNVKNITGVVYKPQYSDSFEPSQLPHYDVSHSGEAGSHQIRNKDIEFSVQSLQNSDIVQPDQPHLSYDGKETVETGSHQVLQTYGDQQPVYPVVIQPDQRPSYDGAGTVAFGTENEINIEGNHVGHSGERLDVQSTVQQPGFPSVDVVGQLPIFSREESVDLNSHHVSQYPAGVQPAKIISYDRDGSIETGMHDAMNFKAENTIHHPHYPTNLQQGIHSTYGGEGTVEHMVQNQLIGVHSGAQSEYPDHLHDYQNGDVQFEIGGTHIGNNLEYSDGTKPVQQPNYQSGVSSMQVEIQQEGANGHQSSYPNENQSAQRVEEFSGGAEQSQLGNSGSKHIGTHELEIEHEQEVKHISYPEVNSDNNMQSGGRITESGNFGSLKQPGYPYLGLQHGVNQVGSVIYPSADMLQGQSSKNMFSQSMAQNYLLKNPRQVVPMEGVLQYMGLPSREKVVQHIVHHHVHMPSLAVGLSGMSAIMEKEKLAECLKKYGNACKQLLKNKYRIPDNNWYKYYNKYVKSSHQNHMKDVDASSKKKLLYSQLYGLYGKQLSQYMKHIPKLEQSGSAESSEQSDENSVNALQLQALLASKKEEGKYPYASSYMTQNNQENYQNMPAAELIPNYNSYLHSEKSAKQHEIKILNGLTPGSPTEDTGSPGKTYRKVIKKIRVRTTSKIRERMSRRNNNGGTENYEDENTTDDPYEIVEYEVEVPEDNNEAKNDNADLAESGGKSNVTTEGSVGEEPN